MSHAYSPDQRKVFPLTRCTPVASIFRDFQKSNSLCGKSLPTTTTNWTGAKSLAAAAAYDAEPPNKSLCSSTGVFTVSSAIEPTIKSDIKKFDVRFRQASSSFGLQESPACAPVFRDIGGFEQTGNNRTPFRARRDHLAEIVDLDPPNAKDRKRHLGVDAFDVRRSDRLLVRLCRGGQERAEAEGIQI